MDYFTLFRGACEALNMPISMDVGNLNVVPVPQMPLDIIATQKAFNEFTVKDWEAFTVYFALDTYDDSTVGLNASLWEAFGKPFSVSLLLASLAETKSSAGFFREMPGFAAPDIPSGVRMQIQEIEPMGERLNAISEDIFIRRMISLLVSRLGFDQKALEDAVCDILESEEAQTS